MQTLSNILSSNTEPIDITDYIVDKNKIEELRHNIEKSENDVIQLKKEVSSLDKKIAANNAAKGAYTDEKIVESQKSSANTVRMIGFAVILYEFLSFVGILRRSIFLAIIGYLVMMPIGGIYSYHRVADYGFSAGIEKVPKKKKLSIAVKSVLIFIPGVFFAAANMFSLNLKLSILPLVVFVTYAGLVGMVGLAFLGAGSFRFAAKHVHSTNEKLDKVQMLFESQKESAAAMIRGQETKQEEMRAELDHLLAQQQGHPQKQEVSSNNDVPKAKDTEASSTLSLLSKSTFE